MLLGLEGQECHVMPYLVHRFLRSCRAIRLHHVAVLFPVRKSCYSCSVAINLSYETCQLSPTAQVGNSLTENLGVVEVVKVR